MGTAYACLHLGIWEEEEVFDRPMYLGHVHKWLRYIDDVLVVWVGDIDSLHEFVADRVVPIPLF